MAEETEVKSTTNVAEETSDAVKVKDKNDKAKDTNESKGAKIGIDENEDVQTIRSTFIKTDNKYLADPLGFRFADGGVNFKAKLIGSREMVVDKDDGVCAETMMELKAKVEVMRAAKQLQHKEKVIINLQTDGIRIAEESGVVKYNHAVHRISYIHINQEADQRAFAYIVNEQGNIKFYAFKTDQRAISIVMTLRDLFQHVYELQNKIKENKVEAALEATAVDEVSPPDTAEPKAKSGSLLVDFQDNDLVTLQENMEMLNLELEDTKMDNLTSSMDTMLPVSPTRGIENKPLIAKQDAIEDLMNTSTDSEHAKDRYAALSRDIMNIYSSVPPAPSASDVSSSVYQGQTELNSPLVTPINMKDNSSLGYSSMGAPTTLQGSNVAQLTGIQSPIVGVHESQRLPMAHIHGSQNLPMQQMHGGPQNVPTQMVPQMMHQPAGYVQFNNPNMGAVRYPPGSMVPQGYAPVPGAPIAQPNWRQSSEFVYPQAMSVPQQTTSKTDEIADVFSIFN